MKKDLKNNEKRLCFLVWVESLFQDQFLYLYVCVRV